MASWSALLALTGFQYSGITKEIKFGNINGKYFWSNGYSYGTVLISQADGSRSVALKVINGRIDILRVTIDGIGSTAFKKVMSIIPGETETIIVKITSPANMNLRI
jgi:hypothetical protein